MLRWLKHLRCVLFHVSSWFTVGMFTEEKGYYRQWYCPRCREDR